MFSRSPLQPALDHFVTLLTRYFHSSDGQHMWYNKEGGPSRDMWAIVDWVQVPNITGDFVLRWRWDTEQNPQIWTHCADVRIVV